MTMSLFLFQYYFTGRSLYYIIRYCYCCIIIMPCRRKFRKNKFAVIEFQISIQFYIFSFNISINIYIVIMILYERTVYETSSLIVDNQLSIPIVVRRLPAIPSFNKYYPKLCIVIPNISKCHVNNIGR